jgi:hypothetical protein
MHQGFGHGWALSPALHALGFGLFVCACSTSKPPPAASSEGSQRSAGAVAVAGVSGAANAGSGVAPTGSASAGSRATSAGASGGSAGSANAAAGIAGATAGAPQLAGSAAVSGKGGAGAVAGSGGGMTATSSSSCGGTRNATPFGCKFAWGTNDPGGPLGAFAGLQFMSKWIGYEVEQDGSVPKCDGCSWLTDQVKSTALVPVYYAYFIGYFGKKNGLPDGNENPNGPNLTTDATNLIREHRAQVIDMYASYAKQTAAVWKDKPLVWLLEGDFVQYAGDSQKNRFSYAELGQLASDITCAIKNQMPNAVVSINHSTWNADQVTQDFWRAMQSVAYDLVWTTGVANNAGFFEANASSSSYNAVTATYKYVHELTGRTIFVDTSFGLSGMSDSWSGASDQVLNARIAEGVIAANVTMPGSGYVAAATTLLPRLNGVCR